MIIGVPREIKNNENRVAITPAGVVSLVKAGHRVLVEESAGLGSGIHDEEYIQAGAEILHDTSKVWEADMVLKVKEPLQEEYKYFRDGLILFTYLHLAANPELTKELKESGVIAVAYETVSDGHSLPLLTPMSEVAGRMATLVGTQFLQNRTAEKVFYYPVFQALNAARSSSSAAG